MLSGELLFIDEGGALLWRENWQTSINRYRAYCREHDIADRDLTSFTG